MNEKQPYALMDARRSASAKSQQLSKDETGQTSRAVILLEVCPRGENKTQDFMGKHIEPLELLQHVY